MLTGSLDKRTWLRVLLGVAVVAAVTVVTLLLGLQKVGPTWSAALQVITAVLGAWLGAILGADTARLTVRNQTRPAVRSLFDHTDRLSALIVSVERRLGQLEETSDGKERARLELEWFRATANQLRNELSAAGSSIEDWRDMAPDLYETEKSNHLQRSSDNE